MYVFILIPLKVLKTIYFFNILFEIYLLNNGISACLVLIVYRAKLKKMHISSRVFPALLR